MKIFFSGVCGSQISEIESKLFSEMQLTLGEEFKKDNLRETLSKLRNLLHI